MDKYQKFIGDIDKRYLTNGQLKLDELLSLHTTFRIGGPTKVFFKAKNVEELVGAVKICRKLKLPYFILGQGSNILVGDSGFKGVVIKNEARKIKILGYKGEIKSQKSKIKSVFVEVESGVLANRLVRYTLNEGLSGLENFLGLPGTVGGAVYTNAHNLKAEDYFGNHLLEAHLLTVEDGIKKASRNYFNFAYDKSRLQETKEVVLSTIFSLKSEDKKRLWEKANKMMAYRMKTQPLGKLCAGCIFKNIKKSEALRIPTPGRVTSAGFLIESAGLKGEKIGKAQISFLHANFILNLGNATALDVLKLMDLVKKKIKKKFGVELEEEIEMIGEFKKHG